MVPAGTLIYSMQTALSAVMLWASCGMPRQRCSSADSDGGGGALQHTYFCMCDSQFISAHTISATGLLHFPLHVDERLRRRQLPN